MVIYEVNLKINSDIYNDFLKWLNKHIKEMLTFSGFISATVLQNTENPINNDISVQYKIDSISFLNDYLENHASHMRAKGLKIFKNQFQATRRILDIVEIIEL